MNYNNTMRYDMILSTAWKHFEVHFNTEIPFEKLHNILETGLTFGETAVNWKLAYRETITISLYPLLMQFEFSPHTHITNN